MKYVSYALLVLLMMASTSQAQTKPRPPGIQQAEQAEEQTQANIPPSLAASQKKLDAVKLQNEAGDLARLAESIPADIANLEQGRLPKDLFEKLKQIERLSKHLREEVKH